MNVGYLTLMISKVSLRTAQAHDWSAVTTLLVQNHLPAADLTPAMLADFLVAEMDARVIGVVGCELRGECALFRSLAVAPAHRNQGVANALTRELERRCVSAGIKRAYLLTRTAVLFAEKYGFRAIPRTTAPQDIRNTSEFLADCCTAASCMAKDL